MKIGITIPNGSVGAPGEAFTWRELRAFAQQSEALGFDSIWVYDHLIFDLPGQGRQPVREAWTVLTGLAEATQRVELGTIVLSTTFRNPALLAKMAVTLDEQSNGRLILGLGAGWHEPEFTMFGVPHDHLADRFEEAIRIIAPLVREGRVDFRGTYSSAVDAVLLPPPARPIPIMIASSGPRMMRLTAQYADSWNMIGLSRPEEMQEKRDALTAASLLMGRDPSTLEVTAAINIGFPDLGELRPVPGPPQTFLTGTTAEIAAGLHAFEASGVGHLMAVVNPFTVEALDRLAKAVSLFRSAGPSPSLVGFETAAVPA